MKIIIVLNDCVQDDKEECSRKKERKLGRRGKGVKKWRGRKYKIFVPVELNYVDFVLYLNQI